MSVRHLKLNLDKTELLFLPGKNLPPADFAITIENNTVLPSLTAKSLVVTLDSHLSCSTNIAVTTRSFRFTNLRVILAQG